LVEQIRDEFDAGKDVNLDSIDPVVVSALMKLFLRELPEPILTYGLYEDFLENYFEPAELKTLVYSLPVANSFLLEALLNFIAKISEHSSLNKMELDALATVFAPNLLKRKHETADSLMKDSRATTEVVMSLVENRAQFTYKKPFRGRESSRTMSFLRINTPGSKGASFVMPPPKGSFMSASAPDLKKLDPSVPVVRRAVCEYDYVARNGSEISVKKGEVLMIVEENNSSWTRVRLNDKEGLIPNGFIKKMDMNVADLPTPGVPSKEEKEKEIDWKAKYDAEVKKNQDLEFKLKEANAQLAKYKQKFGKL